MRPRIYIADFTQDIIEAPLRVLNEYVNIKELNSHHIPLTDDDKKAVAYRTILAPLVSMAAKANGHEVNRMISTPAEASDIKAEFSLAILKPFYNAQKSSPPLPYIDTNEYVLMYISDELANDYKLSDAYHLLGEYSPSMYNNVLSTNGRPTSLTFIRQREKEVFEGCTPGLHIPCADFMFTEEIKNVFNEIREGKASLLDIEVVMDKDEKLVWNTFAVAAKKAGYALQKAKYSSEDLRRHFVSFDNTGVDCEWLNAVYNFISKGGKGGYINKSTQDYIFQTAFSRDKSSSFYKMLSKFYPTKSDNALIRNVLLTDDVRPTTSIRPHEFDLGTFTMEFKNDINPAIRWVESVTLPAGIGYRYYDDDRVATFGGTSNIKIDYDENVISSDTNKLAVDVAKDIKKIFIDQDLLSEVIVANRNGVFFTERSRIDTIDYVPGFAGNTNTFLRLDSGSKPFITGDRDGLIYFVKAIVTINEQHKTKEERLPREFTYEFSTAEEAAHYEKYIKQCIGLVLPEYVTSISRNVQSRDMMLYERDMILDEKIPVNEDLFRFLFPNSDIHFVNADYRMSTTYKSMLVTEAEKLANETYATYGSRICNGFIKMIENEGVVPRQDKIRYRQSFEDFIRSFNYDHDYITYFVLSQVVLRLKSIRSFYAKNSTSTEFPGGESDGQKGIVGSDLEEHNFRDDNK